jgi:hypothetical protein
MKHTLYAQYTFFLSLMVFEESKQKGAQGQGLLCCAQYLTRVNCKCEALHGFIFHSLLYVYTVLVS